MVEGSDIDTHGFVVARMQDTEAKVAEVHVLY